MTLLLDWGYAELEQAPNTYLWLPWIIIWGWGRESKMNLLDKHDAIAYAKAHLALLYFCKSLSWESKKIIFKAPKPT